MAAVPIPPPYSGPEINGALLLREGLGPGIELRHVRTNVHSTNRDKGHVTLRSVVRMISTWVRTVALCIWDRPALFYLYLSQNTTGFLRDALLIGTAHLAGLAVVVHVRGANFDNFAGAAPGWLSVVIRRVFRRVAAVIVVADRLKPQFTGLIDPSRLWVVYNAVASDCVQLVNRTGMPCTVLFMGHLSVAKGFADLIHAAPRVLDAVPGLRFEFAGEWLVDERNILKTETGMPVGAEKRDLREGLRDVATRYPDRVRLLGVVTGDAKAEAFRRASVFVLPSYSEGFPAAVGEAMAAGLPLIVTPVGALPEILKDGEHALFVKVGDVDGLVDALIRLGSDSAARGRMGQANAALVRQQLTPAATTQALVRCFRAAVALR